MTPISDISSQVSQLETVHQSLPPDEVKRRAKILKTALANLPNQNADECKPIKDRLVAIIGSASERKCNQSLLNLGSPHDVNREVGSSARPLFLAAGGTMLSASISTIVSSAIQQRSTSASSSSNVPIFNLSDIDPSTRHAVGERTQSRNFLGHLFAPLVMSVDPEAPDRENRSGHGQERDQQRQDYQRRDWSQDPRYAEIERLMGLARARGAEARRHFDDATSAGSDYRLNQTIDSSGEFFTALAESREYATQANKLEIEIGRDMAQESGDRWDAWIANARSEAERASGQPVGSGCVIS